MAEGQNMGLVGLNPHQARSLAITAQWVEQLLEEAERFLERPPASLPVSTVGQLKPLHFRARQQIKELVSSFHLKMDTPDATRKLDALLSSALVALEELRPAKLGRFGPVDQAVSSRLDPLIDGLIQTLGRMESLVRGRPQ